MKEQPQNKIIFVDFFNTIVHRKFSAKQVLFNWCKKLQEKYSIDAVVLYKLFYKFYVNLSVKNFFSKINEAEVTFDELMDKISSILEKNILEKSFNISDFKKYALLFYIEAESESHILNDSVAEKLKDFKDNGYRIYILSEFYCSSEVLKIWLNNFNILHLFDDVFVSGDYKKSKRSGRLYRAIIKKLNLNKKDISMYGDNIFSDILAARLVGIKATQVKKRSVKKDKTLKDILKYSENYKEYQSIFNEYGSDYNFSNYAFTLYLFTKRLCSELESKNVKNAFFLSREGYFLKKLFDKFCLETGNGKDIKTHYLEVSRNSVFRANLKPLNEMDFSYITKKNYFLNVNKFLISIEFSTEEIEKIKQELNININKNYFLNFNQSKVFKQILENETFKNLYESKRKGQHEAFGKYLKSFNVDFNQEGLHIIDVGWRGTMQNLISTFLRHQVPIFGYYVAFTKILIGRDNNYLCDNSVNVKKGLLYQKGKRLLGNKMFSQIFFNLNYEEICRAPYNRVNGYILNNSKPEVTYAPTPNDKALHEKYILPIQNQIEEKFNKLCKFDVKNLSLIEPIAIKMYYKMIKNYSKSDLNFILDAHDSHYDTFVSVGSYSSGRGFKSAMYKMLKAIYTIVYYRSQKQLINQYIKFQIKN